MELRIVHLYPDLMSLYGGYANVSVLKRCLEGLGHTVAVDRVCPGETPDLAGADFIYLGAGTERASLAALAALAPHGEALKAAMEDGAAMLFAGTAMELLGKTLTEADGTVRPGLGLGAFTVRRGDTRIVGDVYGRTDLLPQAVVGFMNKCAVFDGIDTPLLREVRMGPGNCGPGTPEGFSQNHLMASELTGPLLVKNPHLLELTARRICRRRGVDLPEDLPRDPWAEQGYRVTEEQLRALADKQ